VVALAHTVDAGVHFGAAGHGAGNFFTQEEIGVVAQLVGGADGIVIGYGDQVHAALFQRFIQGTGLVIGFEANAGHHWHRAHAGVPCVDVEIAPHAPFVSRGPLQIGELATKQL
jgi:hypothetical protein